MKKITSLILSAALALSLMPSVLVSAATSNVKTQTYTVSGVEDFPGVSLTSTETKVLENNGATWYGKLSQGNIEFKHDEWTAASALKFHSWDTSQATVGAIFDTEDREVSGVTAGSGILKGGSIKNNNSAELRYLVSEDSTTYFGFGAEYIRSLETSENADSEKLYYTVSGVKTYLDEGNTLSATQATVSFTVSGTTVSYSIVTDVKTLTGNFEVANIETITENHKYPVQVYVNMTYDSQFYADSVSVTYTTIKPREIKGSYTLGALNNGNKTFDNNNGVIIEDGDNAVWYGKKLSGYSVNFEKTEWDAANAFRLWTYYNASGVISCVPNTKGRVINALTGGSAIINPNKMDGTGTAELRYLASTDMTKYFGFGIDVANSKLYYTLNGTKTDITDSNVVTWPTSSDTKVTFTVSGSTVTCNFTAGDQTASKSFVVDNMEALIDGCEYPMQCYTESPSGEKYMVLKSPSISYTTIAGPNFFDDFSSYDASNSAYGETNAVGECGYNEGNVIANRANGKWVLSDLVSGTIDSGEDAWTKQQKAYIKEAGNLYLDGSYNVCGVNLELTDRICDVDKIELTFTVSRSLDSAVRFMVNDYEKTAYEIGVKKDGIPFVRKREGMYGGQFNYFNLGVVEGSEQVGTSDIVGWDMYAANETQPKRNLKLTVTFNDAGFDYKLENLSMTKDIFQGTYTDPTGMRIKPNYDRNPVLQVVNAEGKKSSVADGTVTEYNGTIVDDVKIWYTPMTEKSAVKNSDGSVTVDFATADLKSNGTITVVAVWYDENGNTIGVTSEEVPDDDEAAISVDMVPASGAATGNIWFWNGSISDVEPISADALNIIL